MGKGYRANGATAKTEEGNGEEKEMRKRELTDSSVERMVVERGNRYTRVAGTSLRCKCPRISTVVEFWR